MEFRKPFVAALTAHIDDSGTDINSPIAVAAGWIAPDPQWKKFTREWGKAKRELGLDDFHMAHFINNNKKSEFADANLWNDRRKRRVLLRLRSIINCRAAKGFAVGVNKKDYDDVIPAELRPYTGEYHYSYAVRALIGWIEQWRAEQGIKEPIKYVFDNMVKGSEKSEIELVFDNALHLDSDQKKYGVHPGCLSFCSRKQVFPLQSADMLAWTSRRLHARRLDKSVSLYPPVVDMWNDWKDRGLCAKHQLRENLEDFVAQNPKPLAGVLPMRTLTKK